jgi:hypothetical protein
VHGCIPWRLAVGGSDSAVQRRAARGHRGAWVLECGMRVAQRQAAAECSGNR